jgi:hypothetical protein
VKNLIRPGKALTALPQANEAERREFHDFLLRVLKRGLGDEADWRF